MMWLARLLVARNPAMTLAHAKRLATAAAILVAVIAIAGGAELWRHFHDAGVRAATNLQRDNADLRANATANAEAGAKKGTRDAAELKEQEGLEHDVDEADRVARSAADDLWNGSLFD